MILYTKLNMFEFAAKYCSYFDIKVPGWELNPDLPGVSPMSYPLDHEVAFLSGSILYFRLETRAKFETLPSKWIIMANLIYITL